MKRHIFDRGGGQESRRLSHYIRIVKERDSRPDKGGAFRAGPMPKTETAMVAFLRIDRGFRA